MKRKVLFPTAEVSLCKQHCLSVTKTSVGDGGFLGTGQGFCFADPKSLEHMLSFEKVVDWINEWMISTSKDYDFH